MKIGDKVSVLDDAISGVVTAIKGNEVTVMTTDGFELDFSKQELIVMDGSISKRELSQMDVSSIISENKTKSLEKQFVRNQRSAIYQRWRLIFTSIN